MKVLLSTGYITTMLLGSFCPMQMASAMPMPEPMNHAEMTEVALTPMVPMTLAVPMSVAAPTIHASHSMPVLPSGDCTTGHCIMMDHSGQENVAVTISPIQIIGGAALPTTTAYVLLPLDALPAPPSDVSRTALAQTITTVVLRV